MLASAFAVIVNFFGALTFGRPEHAKFYVIEPTQRVLYSLIRPAPRSSQV
jgi:hypothetical protein